MSILFREDPPPERKYKGKYTNYTSYKPHLRSDFNMRCGYTDCPDFWFGGKGSFHIDHFKPWKKYPALKSEYSNLVYSCSYVNILKSNDEGDFIDPCDVNFNDHFERATDGSIVPKATSKEANFMYNKLKLYIKRYQIIWSLEQLVNQMEKLKIVIEATPNGDLKTDLRATQGDLANLLLDYLKYLKKEQ